MPMKKKAKHGKKLARAKPLKNVKPLQVDGFLTLDGIKGGSTSANINPRLGPVEANPALIIK